jgi:hypothetical protein
LPHATLQTCRQTTQTRRLLLSFLQNHQCPSYYYTKTAKAKPIRIVAVTIATAKLSQTSNNM